jgi:hypothetical protein
LQQWHAIRGGAQATHMRQWRLDHHNIITLIGTRAITNNVAIVDDHGHAGVNCHRRRYVPHCAQIAIMCCADGRTSFSQVQLNVTDTARPIGIFSVQLLAARTQNPFMLNLGRPFALSAQDMNNSRSVHVNWFANKDVDINNIEI